eukprot:3342895-Pleurochrysis_carterae.AAC.1
MTRWQPRMHVRPPCLVLLRGCSEPSADVSKFVQQLSQSSDKRCWLYLNAFFFSLRQCRRAAATRQSALPSPPPPFWPLCPALTVPKRPSRPSCYSRYLAHQLSRCALLAEPSCLDASSHLTRLTLLAVARHRRY